MREGKQKVYWGLSYMREYNEIEIVEDAVTIFRDHRMSTYLSMTLYPFEENFSIANTTYYQPVWTNFSDVRLSEPFKIEQGCRQGSICSPFLYNVFINELLHELSKSPYGLSINAVNVCAPTQADDVVLISLSREGLRHLLDICKRY